MNRKLALPATPKLGDGGSGVERVDNIIQAVAAATFTAGVTEIFECDQGSRARDWEIENHDVVTAEIRGAHASRVLVSAASRNELC